MWSPHCGTLTCPTLVYVNDFLHSYHAHFFHLFIFCLCRSGPLSQPRNRHLQCAESVHGASRPDRGGREEDGRDGRVRRGGGRGARLSRLPSNILSQRSSLGGGEEQRERQHVLPVPGAGERLSRVQGGGAMIRHLEKQLLSSWFSKPLSERKELWELCKRSCVRVCVRAPVFVCLRGAELSLSD